MVLHFRVSSDLNRPSGDEPQEREELRSVRSLALRLENITINI
jgi:hypothetical protein